MGIRDEQKNQTRAKILKTTESLLLLNGFVKVSTKDISTKSNVAQGSIFLHFTSKDNLLHIIVSSGIEKLSNDLRDGLDINSDRESFLRDLLDILGNNENMLSRVYKDYAYLSENLKKDVDKVETAVKNVIFDNLRATKGKSMSIIDFFISIDAFIAQIKQNLIDKEVYSDFSSILRQRRGKLSKLYRTLFE